MATYGTPYEGRDNVIVPAVYTGLDLRLYTNAADSLDETTTLGDLTHPSGTGYATLSLSGTWSSTNGVVTYDDGTPDDPRFTAGSNWTGGDVVGACITDGTYILHFMDLSAPVTMTNGKVLIIDLSSLIS